MAAPTKIIAGLGIQLGAKILSMHRATGKKYICIFLITHTISPLFELESQTSEEHSSGDYRTDFSEKAEAIVDSLSARAPYLDSNQKTIFPMGFLHIKAVDDAGHDKDTNLKV